LFLNILLVASVVAIIYFSLQHRTYKNQALRRMGKALTNIAMGCMLLVLCLKQLTFPDLTTVRLGIAILFLAYGTVNLWMGFKNYRFYKLAWEEQKER
jgi:hypothetical protein